ncbi:MAG TPA: undecaprenyl-diphosphate phosphatase [bacterium]|jgi:undecaprenyl-diphosphatase
MTTSDALLLGLIQGLTEFLPVSSSGHLVIAQDLIGFQGPGIVFDILLHGATLGAVMLYFWRDVAALLASLLPGGDVARRRLVGLILLATIPTGVIGLSIDHYLSGLFESARFAAAMLVVTGLVLLVAERTRAGTGTMEQVSPMQAVLLGTAQGIAVLPGISRAGSTIATGLMLGMDAQAAARFSFLMSIPAILAAVALHARDLASNAAAGNNLLPMAAGAGVAFVSGLGAIHLLLKLLARRKLWPFSVYCWAVALWVLV